MYFLTPHMVYIDTVIFTIGWYMYVGLYLHIADNNYKLQVFEHNVGIIASQCSVNQRAQSVLRESACCKLKTFSSRNKLFLYYTVSYELKRKY